MAVHCRQRGISGLESKIFFQGAQLHLHKLHKSLLYVKKYIFRLPAGRRRSIQGSPRLPAPPNFKPWIYIYKALHSLMYTPGADPGGVRGVCPNPPWLVSHFAPQRHLWTNIKTNCFSCLGHQLQFAILSTSIVSPALSRQQADWCQPGPSG